MPSTTTHHVLLVPGFFGFANFGSLDYFPHVEDLLRELYVRRGLVARIWRVRTFPTASLRRRASALADAVAVAIAEKDVPVHLVGHSTGGLDARLFVTPGATLASPDVEVHAARVASVVSVLSPHRGTPIAATFSSLLGVQLLRALSVVTMHAIRTEHLRLDVLVRLAGALVRPEARAAEATLSRITSELLSDFSADRRRAIEEFLADVGKDQDLLPQLTRSSLDLFNAATPNRPSVRYGCVVAAVPSPGVRSLIKAGPSPYRVATHAVYLALHRLCRSDGRMPGADTLTDEQRMRLEAAFTKLPDRKANDGIVPALSQVWGTIVHATWADHLDVIGHFHYPSHVPPHFDWLRSGSEFSRASFEQLWSDVVEFQLAA
jgi:triacylglycerol lipase